MDCSALHRSMRLSIIEGALATSMGTLLSGAFLTGFALLLGATPIEIGILASLPALSNVAQLAGSFWMEKWGQRKPLCIGSTTASRLLWIPLLLLPALMGTGSRTVIAVILVAGISNLLAAIGGVAWLAWIRDIIPQRERIGFLAVRNQFDTALALILSLLGAAFVDWWQSAHPGSINGYVIVFAIAVACGVVGITILNCIPDPGHVRGDSLGFREMLSAPFRDINFRRLLGFYTCWSFASNLSIPFFAVFMLSKLKLPLWQVTMLYTMSSIAGLATSRMWAGLSLKHGTKLILLIATLVEAFFPLWWLFVSSENSWLLPLIFLTGIVGSPLATGSNNLLLAIAPVRNATPYMAVFSTVMGLMTAVASIIGGSLVESFEATLSATTSGSIDSLRFVFLISFLGRMASLPLLRSVNEPQMSQDVVPLVAPQPVLDHSGDSVKSRRAA